MWTRPPTHDFRTPRGLHKVSLDEFSQAKLQDYTNSSQKLLLKDAFLLEIRTVEQRSELLIWYLTTWIKAFSTKLKLAVVMKPLDNIRANLPVVHLNTIIRV